MALQSQILLFISLSFLVFQIATPTPTPAFGPTSTPTRISTISFPPNASPSLSPSQSSSSSIRGDKGSAHKYIASLMESSVAKTEKFIGDVVEKRLADTSADAVVKDCLLVCKEVYENGVSSMKKTIEDLNGGCYYSANVDLSALSTDVDTCMDCVKEVYGDDKEFNEFNQFAQSAAHDALEKVVAITS